MIDRSLRAHVTKSEAESKMQETPTIQTARIRHVQFRDVGHINVHSVDPIFTRIYTEQK